jgi:hypothetical protein
MDRPTGVTIIAALAFVGAAGAAVVAVFLFAGGTMLGGLSGTPGSSVLAGWGAMAGAVFLILAAVVVAIGLGLLNLQNWARVATVVFMLFFSINAIRGMFWPPAEAQGAHLIAALEGIAVDVWIIWYLFRPHVSTAFAQSSEFPPVSSARGVPEPK